MGQRRFKISPQMVVASLTRFTPGHHYEVIEDGLPEDVKYVRTVYSPSNCGIEFILESNEWVDEGKDGADIPYILPTMRTHYPGAEK